MSHYSKTVWMITCQFHYSEIIRFKLSLRLEFFAFFTLYDRKLFIFYVYERNTGSINCNILERIINLGAKLHITWKNEASRWKMRNLTACKVNGPEIGRFGQWNIFFLQNFVSEEWPRKLAMSGVELEQEWFWTNVAAAHNLLLRW